jgi:hypothetical protein
MPMATPNTVTRTASGIEALVCADIARRQQLGIHKYGRTVADNPLALGAWLRHAYEEALDLAIYLRRAMHEQAPPAPDARQGLPAEKPLPVLELLEWWDANTSKPDADLATLLWVKSDDEVQDFAKGAWDGEAWVYAESGELIAAEVLYFSEPGGPK